MSGAEWAFFACAGVTAFALVVALRRSRADLLWWSGVPHALLFHAPVVAWGLAALGLAAWVRSGGAGEGAVASGAGVGTRLPRAVFVAMLTAIALGTWARQVVTAGATAEEAGELAGIGAVMRAVGAEGGATWMGIVAATLVVAVSIRVAAESEAESDVAASSTTEGRA